MANDGPIPIEALRDLLALARGLFLALSTMGPGDAAQRLKLQGIGYQLRLALDKAKAGEPGSMAHRSAWLIAEQAVQDLGAVVDAGLPAAVLVRATGERLVGRR